jgi:hypothetical protein
LGPKFLQEVQIHYDMNLKSEMLTEKLQMLVLVYTLVQRNFFFGSNSGINLEFLGKHKKFPKQGFPYATFDKWLHRATFWHQV